VSVDLEKVRAGTFADGSPWKIWTNPRNGKKYVYTTIEGVGERRRSMGWLKKRIKRGSAS